jgi:TonB family protein
MNRLEKKCFIASAGFHLLLALILLVGPAFIGPSQAPPDNMPILDFIPLKTVDTLISGGGDPDAKPPPAPPPQRPPDPAPPAPVSPAVAERDLPKDPPKPDKAEESLEVTKKPKIDVNTTPKIRQRDPNAEAKARDQAKAREQAKAWAEAQRKMAQRIGELAEHIGSDMSGSTTVTLKGPGGGGVPYANFLQSVKSAYARAWVVPDGVTDDTATTVASVTIARDGTVVKSSITRRSSSPAVDQSVQATLDRVRYAAPLPDDAKEEQRTVTINFNVRAKRLAGG